VFCIDPAYFVADPVYIGFHEWGNLFRDIFSSGANWRGKIGYLLHRPGWRHDGTGKVSEDLRREYLESKKQS